MDGYEVKYIKISLQYLNTICINLDQKLIDEITCFLHI